LEGRQQLCRGRRASAARCTRRRRARVADSARARTRGGSLVIVRKISSAVVGALVAAVAATGLAQDVQFASAGSVEALLGNVENIAESDAAQREQARAAFNQA